MQLPREVVIGENTLDLIVPICRKLGLSKSVFVVTGVETCKVAGRRVIDSFKNSEVNVDFLLTHSSTLANVDKVQARIDEVKPQVVLGVGGGTKIDIAKLSAARQGIPFMSIPTTASHDGIASPLASIKGSEKPYSIMAQAPMAIIADTNVIIQASHRYTASGCGDVIAKFTSVTDWNLAHKIKGEYYGEYAANLALMSAKLVARGADSIKPGNEQGLRVLLEALISCGVAMSIAGSSRPSSGSEHLFSHALDLVASKPALHGEQAGVGAIMMSRLQGLNWRRIRSKLEKVGAPTTAGELGVEPQEVVESLVKARSIRSERFTILDKKKLTDRSARALAKKTGVI
ncbi:MAG: NAD(P)-dependent glycerol-1-phosphate dehydrogenase [Candidatus Bathyarchaeota archaeon]|nr:MAG: NAD(P)-dependent glycerol-1-phosphate dehydrogenase [Candidatus Bathyarchaeota archaeon]